METEIVPRVKPTLTAQMRVQAAVLETWNMSDLALHAYTGPVINAVALMIVAPQLEIVRVAPACVKTTCVPSVPTIGNEPIPDAIKTRGIAKVAIPAVINVAADTVCDKLTV